MIEIERKDALTILKLLSQVDGYLLGIESGNCGSAAELLNFPCDLLIDKLAEENEK